MMKCGANDLKKGITVKDFEELTAEWEDLLEILRCGKPDLDVIKRLIFDTYWFLKADLTDVSIPRDRLELYKYIGQVCQSLYTDYPTGWKHSETLVFHAFASGLCFVYEAGFVAYGKNNLRLVFVDEPAGFYEPEADMTTFESFEKDFNKIIGWYQDIDDDEDEDE